MEQNTAPASTPAPASEPGTVTVLPGTGAALSATTQASLAAIANINAGKSADGQVRASDGTFAPPLPPNPLTPPAQPAAPVAPEAGQVPPADPNAQPDGEGTPPIDAASETAVVLALADGTEVDLDLGDADLAATVRDQIAVARDAEAIVADAEAQIADAVAFREAVSIDPVRFVEREIGDNPAAVDHLIRSLLTNPEHFERNREVLATILDDESAFRLLAAETRASSAEFREQAQERIAQNRAIDENLRGIQNVCRAMIPDTMPDNVKQTLFADMLRDIGAAADRMGRDTIPLEDIPVLLTNRLTAAGLDPVSAAQAARQVMGSTSRRGAAARVGSKRPAAPITQPAARQTPNGAAFVAGAERRKAVAIPSAGSGSPSTAPDLTPPRNADGSAMSVAQTVAWHRSRVATGNVVLR